MLVFSRLRCVWFVALLCDNVALLFTLTCFVLVSRIETLNDFHHFRRQAKIRGDAAICRYLARICQPYDAEGCDAVRATEIDAWTDAANCTR